MKNVNLLNLHLLQNWIDNQITYILNPIKDKLDEEINSNIRAIAFNCFENLGTLKVDDSDLKSTPFVLKRALDVVFFEY